MATEHVVHGLVRKYAELAGQLKKLDAETARLADELNHVRAAILIFEPGYRIKAIAPTRPKSKSAHGPKGALNRAVMDALRQATAAMSARELAERVLTGRGVLEPTGERVTLTIRAINVSLASLRKRGIAVCEGDPRRWRLEATQAALRCQ